MATKTCSQCHGDGVTVWIPPDLTADPQLSTCSACSGRGEN